jgi:transposase InsO family protein
MPVAPNLLSSNFTREAPNRVWASDIPSSPTGEGWPYVAIVPPSWPKPPVVTASVKTSGTRAVTIGMSPRTPH